MMDMNTTWIPCAERLPETDSMCLVTVEYHAFGHGVLGDFFEEDRRIITTAFYTKAISEEALSFIKADKVTMGDGTWIMYDLVRNHVCELPGKHKGEIKITAWQPCPNPYGSDENHKWSIVLQ